MARTHSLVRGIIAAALLFGLGAPASAQTVYTHTGGLQNYIVPAGVTSITVKAWGAGGGGGNLGPGGGGGGFAAGTISVTPGETLSIIVGGGGQSGGNGGLGGFGGGANGHVSGFSGAGGGGLSGVKRAGDFLLVGGGGGGAGGFASAGAGGGATGADGSGSGFGGGGTQTFGGAGGGAGGNGTAGFGGAGSDAGGGGGGGGYFGGGGGSASGAGGGGGSGFVTGAFSPTLLAGSGVNPANSGDPDWVANVGFGGSGFGDGQHGRVVIFADAPSVVPEPASLALLPGASLAVLVLRRRKA